MRVQRRVLAPDAVQLGYFPYNSAWAIPVPGADFIFFAVQIFLPLRVGLAFTELEAVVDPPEAGQRRGQGGADQKRRTRRILQKVGINVGRVDKEMRPEESGERLAGQFRQIRGQLGLRVAPGEISVALREASLGEPVHDLGPGERLGQKDDL